MAPFSQAVIGLGQDKSPAPVYSMNKYILSLILKLIIPSDSQPPYSIDVYAMIWNCSVWFASYDRRSGDELDGNAYPHSECHRLSGPYFRCKKKEAADGMHKINSQIL